MPPAATPSISSSSSKRSCSRSPGRATTTPRGCAPSSRSGSPRSGAPDLTALPKDTTIGVLGAGAMGGGIAQVAATAGHKVMVTDAREEALIEAAARLETVLAREVEKGRLTTDAAHELGTSITWAPGAAGEIGIFRHCGLVIEAIAEDL